VLEPFRHFNACPRCGAPGPGEASPNPFRCAACGFVLYFNAASAVAALVARDDGRVLWIERAREPAKGKLGMPGGFVDIGETAEDALRRETREEVGIDLDGFDYMASFPNRYVYADVTYCTLDLFFAATTRESDRARALDAVSRVEWRDPGAIDPAELAFDSMRRALAAYLGRRKR
jgi:ADP-ribose pyrophosphatase YjhB (NUDIX family)